VAGPCLLADWHHPQELWTAGRSREFVAASLAKGTLYGSAQVGVLDRGGSHSVSAPAR